MDRRVQIARGLIPRGRSILDAALETFFFDQAHFHRAFKRATAITPGEYAR
ncbi:helix-turn-helix domain-containing protein [Pleomorphomonas sp. JP5]|uniref:helix-turn-helix domain-containing protein n=1 Tax=Pleomorphomonas sp. JP5 TaxID=2942998 RepID=UPI00386217FB